MTVKDVSATANAGKSIYALALKNLTISALAATINPLPLELNGPLGLSFVLPYPLSDVIKLDPEWAEAWNKRATVLYLMGDYQASQNDIDKVLILEKRHFGALAGQGLVNIKLENFEKAIESYKKAQEIYPAMQSPKIMIDQIKELIKRELI